jgi:N-acetyl-gamma-glutamyl-phosphate reductase
MASEALPAAIGIVGARGHTGAELVRLLAGHPGLRLAFVASRELDGQRVADHVAGYAGDLRYTSPSAAHLPALAADGIVLALPHGKAAPYLDALASAGQDPVVVDLSADHRFDDTWVYGQPERNRHRIRGA